MGNATGSGSNLIDELKKARDFGSGLLVGQQNVGDFKYLEGYQRNPGHNLAERKGHRNTKDPLERIFERKPGTQVDLSDHDNERKKEILNVNLSKLRTLVSKTNVDIFY